VTSSGHDLSEKEILAATREINNVVVNSSQAMVTLLREQAKNGDQKAADLLKVFDEQTRRAQEARLKEREMTQRERLAKNPSTDKERILKEVMDLQKAGKIDEANQLIKTYTQITGVDQRIETAADKTAAAIQAKLMGNPRYTNAFSILNNPAKSAEEKAAAQRTIDSLAQAAGLQSGATMAPNVPPPNAVREIKK
jgi:uroporphyrinogen-III decarboxylase